MKNKQIQIPFRRSIVAVFFVLWGLMWLIFADTGPFDDLFGGLFVIVGLTYIVISLAEVLRYRKTGEFKTRLDERAEINALRASRKGFVIILVLMSLLLALLGFGMIPESAFVAFTGVVIGASVVAYFLSFYRYERERV